MSDTFRDALDRAREDVLSEAEDAVRDVRDTAEREAGETVEMAVDAALNPLQAFLSDPDDVPDAIDLGEDHNFRHAAGQLLAASVDIYAKQAVDTIRALREISVEATEEGSKILQKMAEVGQLVADGRISTDSGQRAIGHYTEALKLIGRKIENRAKVEAYKRAMAALSTAKSVLYTGLQVALQLGKQAALAYIGKIPTPPTPA